MIKRIFKKTISVFLTIIFISGFFPPVSFAQSNPSSFFGEIRGFNRSIFDSHFSRADRELTPGLWLAEARFGLTQAINAWELISGSLYDNPLVFEDAKMQLQKWSDEELEKRFSQWLFGRFFGEAVEKVLIEISSMFNDSQKNTSWFLDSEGNIVFDDKSGSLLTVSPNEENRELTRDLLLWQSNAKEQLDNILSRLYPELLAFIPDELRETMNDVIYETASAKNIDIKREFENIAAREERIFTSRRVKEIRNLRNQGDNESARLFTERLISETEEACNRGIEDLNSRIEQAAAGTGDLALNGEEWLRLYKEQFDRGLKAWEEAEERFFIRRIEWEQESFKLFTEGEEIWLSAFKQFEDERSKWELKAKELFQAGETLFKNISEDFDRTIAEAKKEFELNMAMRIGEGTTRVKALIDMYLISSSAAISSMENIKFWESQNNAAEMLKSQNMYNTYINNALDARDRIIENYGELFGTGTLKDILNADASSEDFFLDEYQIALVRAKALVLYWERKTAVSEAVMSFAGDFNAGRITEAQRKIAWEEAKADYNRSLSVYEIELKKLNEAGEDIKKQQEVLHNLALQMQKEEELLIRLNSDYSALVSISIVNRENYYLTDFNTKYNYLADVYNYFHRTGTDSVYYNILEYGLLWGIAEQRETEEKINHMLETSEDLSEEEKAAIYDSFTAFILSQDEVWQNTCDSLSSLFINYGITQEYDFFPDFTHIINAILSKPGSVILNTNKFLSELDECFQMIPVWMEIEIINWKKALSEYISIYTQNPDNNDKHWRQYLIDEYIIDNDPVLVMASSFKEGLLADALYNAIYYTNRVNDSFLIYSKRDMFNADENAAYYFMLYTEEVSRAVFLLNSLEIQFKNILNAARAYEFSKMSAHDADTQLSIKEEELRHQEEAYKKLRDEYFLEAGVFAGAGSVYDNQYSLLKKAHEDIDRKRFEYEKQDAIQRWVSTSYLDTGNNDLENNKAKLTRAQTVLDVLSDLYNNENKRSSDNPEYNALYLAYEQNFQAKLKILEAAEILSSAIKQEEQNNKKLYSEYQSSLNLLGYIDYNYSNYFLPENPSDWSVKNIITVKDGRLAFNRDETMTLSGTDSFAAEELMTFFNTRSNAQFDISQYEVSIRDLSLRMTEYFLDIDKFKQWSLAREYLLYSLINSNNELKFLQSHYHGLGEMESGGSLAEILVKTTTNIWEQSIHSLYSVLSSSERIWDLENIFKNAWDGLTDEERADLEFYTLLTMHNIGGAYFEGFSKMHSIDIYMEAVDYVNLKYYEAVRELGKWWNAAVFGSYREMRDLSDIAWYKIMAVYEETQNQVDDWMTQLMQILSSIQINEIAYNESCEKLVILTGIKGEGQNTGWNEINLALQRTETNIDGIAGLQYWWELMQESQTMEFINVPDALTALLRWSREEEINAKRSLETRWVTDAQHQQQSEFNFQAAVDAYIAGTITAAELNTAANNAYGKNSIALKNHLDNVHAVIFNSLSMYINMDFDFYSEFNTLGEELALLTGKILENRYTAELAAREIEWSLSLKDITEKFNEWKDSTAKIMENGRTDWSAGLQKMEAAYREWNVNFQNEYERINEEWAQAYLAGLEDKEQWLLHAANAANQASSESFLSLVGTEGERLSRFMDVREPLGIRNAIPEARSLMSDLLQSSGIVNMSIALNSLNSIAGTASYHAKRGLGGINIWNAAFDKTAASDLARKINSDISDSEARKLAFNARLAADEAIRGLAVNTDKANQDFRRSMNDHFIFNGLWRRSGNNYVKEVIKGSTFFTPVISETVTIMGYIDYIMEPILLKTNLDDINLENLNSIAIRGLLENVFIEVQAVAKEIFGSGADSIKINRSGIEREQSAGKFGAHIGYSPADRLFEYNGTNKKDMFYDEGAGELGRLLSEFTYWDVIDKKGSAELTIAPWDKRMWNDNGSWFSAPSLRTVGSIAASIAAGAVTGGAGFAGLALYVGISSSSDILFGTLDAANGYKTFDESAFGIGKSVLTSTVNGLGAAAFNGISMGDNVIYEGLAKKAAGFSDSPVYKVAANTAMTGLQTASTSIAASAINGITYNSGGKFGYNQDILNSGMNNLLAGTSASMMSAFTSASLKAVNSGFNFEKLTGFSNANKNDVAKLNDLIGSFAGQGVNYALGNDFTLNMLNMSMITGNTINGGLLELRLGRDNTKMNFGTGGANVSFDNILASARGAQVWNVNSHINSFTGNNGNFDSSIALRAQYGYGDNVQKGQLWDIINDIVTINTEAQGNYIAQTSIDENGKRVINLAGYQKGMSMEEQMFLAAILGHEAYRDGYKTGEIDASGNIVTRESSFNELREASIARLAMSDRISYDYNDFYSNNPNFDLENLFLLNAKETGDYSLFDDFLRLTYNNDEDYFWLSTSTGNNYQNENRYRNIPLFNAASQERVNEINEEGRQEAYERYLLRDKEDGYITKSWEVFKENKTLLEDNGFIAMNFISLHSYGCRFMSVKYALEAITGKYVNALQLHDYAKRNRYYSGSTLLSSKNMADIMTGNTDGLFTITVDKLPEKPDIEQLYRLEQSQTMYLACLKVGNGSGGDHFVMLSGIDFTFDDEGNPTGISEVRVANPWNSNGVLGKQSYSFTEINRWDIFSVRPTQGSIYSVMENAAQIQRAGYHQNYIR
ncbi:MAG: hypothetical protein FWD40_11310 [Treponema sp.]|nr:hypothetical protein [Treponema sp.]